MLPRARHAERGETERGRPAPAHKDKQTQANMREVDIHIVFKDVEVKPDRRASTTGPRRGDPPTSGAGLWDARDVKPDVGT